MSESLSWLHVMWQMSLLTLASLAKTGIVFHHLAAAVCYLHHQLIHLRLDHPLDCCLTGHSCPDDGEHIEGIHLRLNHLLDCCLTGHSCPDDGEHIEGWELTAGQCQQRSRILQWCHQEPCQE